MEPLIRFVVTFIATSLVVALLVTLYEGSTAEGYRSLDQKTRRIVAFSFVVAVWAAILVVAIGVPLPGFSD